MNKVDVRQKIIAAEAINNASLIKRLRGTFVRARKIDFLNKLDQNAEMKRKMEKLKKFIIF